MQMSGITPEMTERVKRNRAKYAFYALATSILMAYVMDVCVVMAAAVGSGGALRIGFWTWAGFIAPILLGSVVWEGRPAKLYAINIGYWFIVSMVMAILLQTLSFV